MTSALIEQEAKDSELRCRLAIACYRNPHRYKQLAEWLEVYNYILPDDRVLGPAIDAQVNGPFNCFVLWRFMDMINCCFTYDEQVMIWKLISESSTSPIRAYLHFTVAPGVFNSIG